ncbi:ABC transporter permease [Jiangella asiatica]|uniref:ABC transporter permease n=1 Tax=Jiangella asiatica TaxID=2530372 RepID=A0A4R5DXL7_9ACTN|nr:ABC transporter permease [Jiangella asiatica]TDE15853.1 ABC transporter permease [Jiangella asiatica]
MTSRRVLRIGVLPLALFYVFFFLLPALQFLRSSLYDSSESTDDGASLTNYRRALGSESVLDSLATTLGIALVTAVVSLLLAYLIAYHVVRGPAWLSRLIMVAALSSLFASAIARALGWRVLLADSGPLNDLLLALGVVDEPVRLINNTIAVTVGMVHVQVPIIMLALIPVIEAVPREMERAAYGLGESRWRTFLRVHLPLTWMNAVPIGLIAVMATAAYFTTPALLGGGRVLVLPILIQQAAQVLFDYATAATLAAILSIVIVAIACVVLVFTRWRRTIRERGHA